MDEGIRKALKEDRDIPIDEAGKPVDTTNYKYLHGTLRNELVAVLNRAAAEIEDERRVNAQLGPRAEAFDAIQQILGYAPRPSQGAKEDMAWRFRQRARELLGNGEDRSDG
jgi:hypothetical protein